MKPLPFRGEVVHQTPYHHLIGNGCAKCGHITSANSCLSDTENFIKKSKKLYGTTYDYSRVNYIKSNQKVIIICKKHGEFLQKPNHHLSNHGCPTCSNNISNSENEFLKFINIKNKNIRLKNWKDKPVDGYDPETNTVYEFLGDYWHGNPERFNGHDINKRTKKSFEELYQNTLLMLNKLKSLGFNVKYIWENDWTKFKMGTNQTLKIYTLT